MIVKILYKICLFKTDKKLCVELNNLHFYVEFLKFNLQFNLKFILIKLNFKSFSKIF